MQLLTTTGYKNIEDCVIGEQLVAYDINDGHMIVNTLENKQWFSPDMFVDEYSESEPTYDVDGNAILDDDGNPVMSVPMLLRTKEQIFIDTYGELDFYKINNTWTLFKNQSIWDNLNVNHVKDLQIGDVVYDGNDNDVTIDSIEEGVALGWWRLTVSGDHSYIADNLTLHNASRYWVGGGSSSNWNATVNTNWGSSSGTQDNASVPASTDDVTFDGAGVGGNTNSTISATITILSLNITTGYTSTMTHNAVLTIAGNFTFTGNYTRAGSSGVTISAASTITSNGVTWNLPLIFSGTNTKTLLGSLTVSGLLTISGAITINKTTTETITTSGGMTLSAQLRGTADLYWTGGTWSGAAAMFTNLYINGNTTMSGSINFNGAIFTWLSGTVTTTGSTIAIESNCTITSGSISFNNIEFSNAGSITKTLVGDLNVLGLIRTTLGTTIINKTTNEVVNAYGGINITSRLQGTANVYLIGGTWQGSADINNNLILSGNVIVSGTVIYRVGTLTYKTGKIDTRNATLSVTISASFIGMNKMSWQRVVVTAGQTITMDRFFVGTPSQICQVSSTDANYTVAFTDDFERMGRYVAISGCTLARPLQLFVTTNSRFNTNRDTNAGLRYVNQLPNGIAKGRPSITDTMIAPAMGLVSDPNFIKQG